MRRNATPHIHAACKRYSPDGSCCHPFPPYITCQQMFQYTSIYPKSTDIIKQWHLRRASIDWINLGCTLHTLELLERRYNIYVNDIQGKAKTIRELLKGIKYSIDYYQREYKWTDKQARELVDDLTGKFLEGYSPDHDRQEVANYPHYFLGAVIISKKDNVNYIVDGQQRLISLSLLLMLIRKLQGGLSGIINVDELIVSERYGKKSFNLDIPDLQDCMQALFGDGSFDPTEYSDSVKNLHGRYQDIEDAWPEELGKDNEAFPYFVDWLLENVHLVEITAHSDDDAYTIFETMNDRGLSLSPTDMLKGYLLANIDSQNRGSANDRWREWIEKLNADDGEADFFKVWLRSQYAEKIREHKKNAKPEEFDLIGTQFHGWLRDNKGEIGLASNEDFFKFIDCNFVFYARQYLRIIAASRIKTHPLEHILYNAQHKFTLQYMVLLAPLKPNDTTKIINTKLKLVAQFIDILIAWRLWNFRSIAHSTMKYKMFSVMRDIRSLEPQSLAEYLHKYLKKEKETFVSNNRLRMHQQNRRYIHLILARLTEYLETSSGQDSQYGEYVGNSTVRYEVEHIWAAHPERYQDEFDASHEFDEYRNLIGGLLLLPKKFNASYGDLPYEKKLEQYRTQNLLAHSLHPDCYKHNPGFINFVKKSSIPFKPHNSFKKNDLEERGKLYQQLAERIWNPEDILREV